ncbi:MAG: lytic transglycosylase domain-containing protein [Pseudomonadota bacterium]
MSLSLAAPVWADSKSTKSRIHLFKNQTKVLDDRATKQYAGAQAKLPASVIGATSLPRYGGSYAGPYLTMARQAARRHGIPEDLFARLVQQESGWNPSAVSHKGAIGLAQLMPGTAQSLGVNPRNPRENLDGGARYLKRQYDRFRSWKLALAAYNAGPGAVERYDGIPPYKETEGYVVAILGQR